MGECPNCHNGNIELVDTDVDFDGATIESWLCEDCECEWEWTTRLNITTEGKKDMEDDPNCGGD